MAGLPATILDDITWSYQQPRYKDPSWLVRAVEQFHAKHRGGASTWKPDALALPLRHVRLRVQGKDLTIRPATPEGFTRSQLLFELHHFARPLLEAALDHFHGRLRLVAAEGMEPAVYQLETTCWLDTPDEQPTGELPSATMNDVRWDFTHPLPVDHAAFAAAHELASPDDIAIPAPVIVVTYSARFGKEHRLVLRSDGKTFTKSALLHQLHLACAASLARVDQHFFAGLVLASGPTSAMPPVYKMSVGS
ncbi:MAG TPA: hypothetical protein VK427_12420, partial [Kofleriaceae bacterium]|nr:hypothetical protein [Kofleriaceae bacterium]